MRPRDGSESNKPETAILPPDPSKYAPLVYFQDAAPAPPTRPDVTIQPGVWNESFPVRSIEADADGLLKMESICNYFQEAAGNHAHNLGVATDQLTEHNLAWVMGRLCFTVTGLPRWRETVHFETWPSGVDRLYAFRDFLGFTESNDRFVEGISTWLLIDPTRRRPVRMPELVTRIPLPERPRALLGILPPMVEPEGRPVKESMFEVYRSDIDVNRHVNNVRFLVWILETLPDPPPAFGGRVAADISFRAEAVLGDPIRVRTWERGDPGAGCERDFLHGVYHGESDRLLASARTIWGTVRAD